MGSFSEVVLSFPLRVDVDDDVLAAFASIALPDADAPELPAPMSDDGEWWLDDPECDMTDPWAHDWGEWIGASYTTAYIGSEQGATMRWRGRQWVVTARATWKSTPEAFVGNLAVLGTVIDATIAPRYEEYVQAGHLATGFFVGYTRHEYEPRPWLLWASEGRLTAENLNPPGFLL